MSSSGALTGEPAALCSRKKSTHSRRVLVRMMSAISFRSPSSPRAWEKTFFRSCPSRRSGRPTFSQKFTQNLSSEHWKMMKRSSFVR